MTFSAIHCTCPAKAGLCNLTDCQQAWAAAYRRSVRPKWWDRAIGTVVALFVGRWR